MTKAPLRILKVGTLDRDGGAAAVARRLMQAYGDRGHTAMMAVGRKTGLDPRVFMLPDEDRTLYRLIGYSAIQKQLRGMAGRFPGRGWGRLSRGLRLAAHPSAIVQHLAGYEDFEFAGTYRLLDCMSPRPTVVHCHNLHGGYFDLRALAWLSARTPLVMTLHDSWLLSGHCAHSFDCERWTTGCGLCPDLTIYPAVRRDATAKNWRRKKAIYQRSRLHLATPCRWLMERVERSMLRPAVTAAKVIPYGIDLRVFHSGHREAARQSLALPRDAFVVLLVLERDGQWEDRTTLCQALDAITEQMSPRPVLFVAVGCAPAAFQPRHAEVRWVGYETEAPAMARHYRAADLFLHCARAATFPNTILEALACGTPVVASAVGGITEQVIQCETGLLVAPGHAAALADAAVSILRDPERARFSKAAAADARKRFDVSREADTYLDWYHDIIESWN